MGFKKTGGYNKMTSDGSFLIKYAEDPINYRDNDGIQLVKKSCCFVQPGKRK